VRFIRFILGQRHEDSGIEEGFFRVAYELRDSPLVEPTHRELLADILVWFEQTLNTPDRFNRTRSKGSYRRRARGIAWFGYINAPRSMGKSSMPDPERAPIVRRVFEEYATGRFNKQQILMKATAWGLRNRREVPLGSQAIGVLLRNQLYAGIVDVPEYGVRNKRGDFDPLVSEATFFRAQRCCQAVRRLRRRSCGAIRISHLASSSGVTPADGA
jgi:hypothetical protein